MNAAVRSALLALATAALPLSAHEGVDHHEPTFSIPAAIGVPAIERPRRLADGSLFVPKAVQRLLQLRTALVGSEPATSTEELIGEVALQPQAGTEITAPQAGRLEATAYGWPVAGQRVAAGETLAWLRPLLPHREAAKRRARIGELEQKLAIAQLNLDRIGLQNEANQGRPVAGNIYLEQAQAELDALRRQRTLLADGLAERLPLRAAVAGQVIAAPRGAGEAVVAGQSVFEIADPAQLRLVATGFDPRPADTVETLPAAGPKKALLLRAIEPRADRPGWQLLFDPVVPADLADLAPGEPVRIVLHRRAKGAPAIDPAACVRDAEGRQEVWVHVAPERFASRSVEGCGSGAEALAVGDRVVIAGAALLSEYR